MSNIKNWDATNTVKRYRLLKLSENTYSIRYECGSNIGGYPYTEMVFNFNSKSIKCQKFDSSGNITYFEIK